MKKEVLYLGLDPTHYMREDREITHLEVIETIKRPFEDASIKIALDDISLYTHMLVTSKQTVKYLYEFLSFYQIVLPMDLSIIAVGEGTASCLNTSDRDKCIVAAEKSQEGILAVLRSVFWTEKSYVFFPRSSLARPLIEHFFIECLIRHQICDLYDTQELLIPSFPDIEQWDEIVFTSPSTVRAFFRNVHTLPKRAQLKAIGEVTWQNLQKAIMIARYTTVSASIDAFY